MADAKPNLPSPVPAGAWLAGPVAAALPRPPFLTSTPDAIGLLKALRRRWGLALSSGLLLAAIVGSAAWFVIPRAKYTASATLILMPRTQIVPTGEERFDLQKDKLKQIAILQSRRVLTDALREAKIASLPTVKQWDESGGAVEWLEEQLKVESPSGSELLQVSLSGDRPGDVADLVNAIVSTYKNQTIEQERKERRQRREYIERHFTESMKELSAKRNALQEMARSIGSSSPRSLEGKQKIKNELMDLTRGELGKVRMTLKKAKAQQDALQHQLAVQQSSDSSPRAIERQVAADMGTEQLRQQIDALQSKYRRALAIAKSPNDPAVAGARREFEAKTRALDAYRSRVRTAIVEENREASLAPLREELAKVQAQVLESEAYEEMLDKDLASFQKENQDLAQGTLNLEDLRSDIDVSDQLSRIMAARLKNLEAEEGAPERILEIDKAEAPRRKDESRRFKVTGIAAASALLVALFGVSFWEFWARRIDTVDEVVHGLGLRLVGALPAAPNRSRLMTTAAQERRWQSLLVESINATRTLLLHASRAESVRVVMVASALKGEGKTTLSCHLATSLALSGRKTLLVDLDLRSPATHRLFDMPKDGPGMSELLRGEANLDDVIRPTPVGELLHLISGGTADSLAIQALGQGGLRPFFDELKARYDFIIVDSAPVLLVADSLQVGQAVDAVIFSILRDVSRVPTVHAAYERLTELGVRSLGAVLTGAQPDSRNPGYAYSYGYGSVSNS